MDLKEQFRQDVEKYGYTVLGVYDTEDPGKPFSIFVFLDYLSAWRVYNNIDYKFRAASYIPVAIAKETALSLNCEGFAVYAKDGDLRACENDLPQCHFYKGFVTGCFECLSLYAKNSTNKKKENE